MLSDIDDSLTRNQYFDVEYLPDTPLIPGRKRLL